MIVGCTNGQVWHSDNNSVTSWNAAASITAQQSPDALTALAKTGQYVVAFGNDSTEWFYNTGNTVGSVLSSARRDIGVGCINGDSTCEMDDYLYFVGTSKLGGIGVYRMRGFEYEKISPAALGNTILLAGTANISLTACRIYDQALLVMRCATATYVYNAGSRMWTEWTGNAVLWDRMAGSSVGTNLPTYAISKTSTSGKVFVINPAAYKVLDNGAAYTCYIQSSVMDFGTNKRKRHTGMDVVGDTCNDTLSVSWTDDDYTTWSESRPVSMSGSRRITRLGQFRKRAFGISWTPSGPNRLEACDVDLEELAS
jgi:hypothetical protein